MLISYRAEMAQKMLAVSGVVAMAVFATANAAVLRPSGHAGWPGVPPHLTPDMRGLAWRAAAEGAAAVAAANSAHCETKETTLDHFGGANSSATFTQHYCVDTSYAGAQEDTPGAVFVVISGEGPMGDNPAAGYVGQLAERHRAVVASLEHRFYGNSVPQPVDRALRDELQFLTVEQALADVHDFVTNVVNARWPKAPVVVIGGSYSGALSAWYRQTYPDSCVASYSSSGVVNAVLDFTAFDAEVAEAAGKTCADILRATTAAMEADVGAAKMAFGVPDLPTNDFWYMTADSAAMAVQYGHKEALCSAMEAATPDGPSRVRALAAFTSSLWGPSFSSNCFYNTSCLIRDAAHWQPTSRSWRWQKCSQVGYLQAAPAQGSIRSTQLTLEVLIKQCDDVFGPGVTDPKAGTQAINAKFGGATPTSNNTFYSNGGDDPWQRAAVASTLSATQPEFTAHCDGCGHCGDLMSPLASDPPELVQQRSMVAKYLAEWVPMH